MVWKLWCNYFSRLKIQKIVNITTHTREVESSNLSLAIFLSLHRQFAVMLILKNSNRDCVQVFTQSLFERTAPSRWNDTQSFHLRHSPWGREFESPSHKTILNCLVRQSLAIFLSLHRQFAVMPVLKNSNRDCVQVL